MSCSTAKTVMEPHYQINIFYSEEDGAYIAEIPELKDCSAFGHSPEEALDEVLVVQELWLQDCIRRGGRIPIPKRRAHDIENSSVRKIRVRRSLRKRLG
jgi:predicted RNase H-like HicB family nuclease